MRQNPNRGPWLALLLLTAYVAAALFYLRSQTLPAFLPLSDPTASGDSQSESVQSFSVSTARDTPPEVPPAAEVVAPAYDFSQPAPESEPVENEYFADAAFVGDSRTDGFMIYSGVGYGRKFVANGLSIFQLAEKKVLTINGQDFTLLEALAQEPYGKVYLCLGVNELGINDNEGFYRSYCEAIDAIRTLQPHAVIYIQGLIPLNEGVVAQTIKRDYLRNDHLLEYDRIMRQVAEEKQVVFLDLYTEFVDENGELPADASRDGVHLLKEGYQKWLAYLKTHTVPYETLNPASAANNLT